jgi:hypothetical protein
MNADAEEFRHSRHPCLRRQNRGLPSNPPISARSEPRRRSGTFKPKRRLGAWYTRSDFARDIRHKPENSHRVRCPFVSETQNDSPPPLVPGRRHQRRPEKRHYNQQGEIDKSHVLMKRHKADVPKICDPRARLVEDLHGIHVHNEKTQREYCRPSDHVAERSFRSEVLPQEEQAGYSCETGRDCEVPNLNQMLHRDSFVCGQQPVHNYITL